MTQDREKDFRDIKTLLKVLDYPDIGTIRWLILKEREVSVYLALAIMFWIISVILVCTDIITKDFWRFIFTIAVSLILAIILTVCFFGVKRELKPHRKLIKLLMDYDLYDIFSVRKNMLKIQE